VDVAVNRLLATWLADATYGVNALLAGVPRLAGHDAPPAVGSILTATDHGHLAWVLPSRDDEEYPGPYLTITRPEAVELEGEQQTVDQDDELSLAIRYATYDLEAGARDADYTMRAVRRSLAELFLNDHDTARISPELSIELVAVLRGRHLSMNEAREGGPLSLLWLPTFQVRDFAPLP